MKKVLLFLFSITQSVFLYAQTIQNFKIYSTKEQKVISLDELIKSIENTDVLFFGEEHNDSIGHMLEYEILKSMKEQFGNVALTMEMFHTDTQPIVDEYLAGLISEKNFLKEARAWNNYQDYKPLIEYAKANKLTVIAANAATRYSNAVTRGGLEELHKFPSASKIFLPPLPVDTATGRYHDKFLETLGGHNMGGMKIYQTQNLWDATMAWSIASYLKKEKKRKVFQINGRFHSDEKLGTVAQLKRYASKLIIQNIACFSSDDFSNPNWDKHQHLGDFIILTNPAIKRTF